MVGTAAYPRVLHLLSPYASRPSDRAMPSRDDGSTTHQSNHPAASILERHVPLLVVVRSAYSSATSAVVFLANLLKFTLDLRPVVGTQV